jgi:hypothetical protein
MNGMRLFAQVGTFALAALPAAAHPAHGAHEGRGELVSVSVSVEGRRSPLYPSADHAARWYLEARYGAHYCLHLRNLTPERLGVLVRVDGLNAISGTQQAASSRRPGRLYVLDGWRRLSVRGWRTSLNDVSRFNFVDEDRSYAVRTGQDNSKLGWIEIEVYRERRPHVQVSEGPPTKWEREPRPAGSRDRAAPPASTLEGRQKRGAEAARRSRSHPGTGWGDRVRDRAVLVDFEPQPFSVEKLVVRYEYREALYALGVLRVPHRHRDRLWERERGGQGFARPPR